MKTPSPPPSPSETVNVLLVDPFPLVRAGLAGLLAQRGGMRVLGEASTADEALHVARTVKRRGRVLALVSLALTGERDADWLIAELRKEFPTFVTIALGAGSEPQAISRALFVGADGFIDAKAQPSEFLDALGEALEGKLVLAGLPRELFGPVAEGVGRPADEVSDLLTPREREVLAAAAGGLTARQIGLRLDVAERTVTTHLANVYAKLGVNGRIAAINFAVRSGLVDVAWPA
jgi:DNA-binding NarL/FixJ family response regulator